MIGLRARLLICAATIGGAATWTLPVYAQNAGAAAGTVVDEVVVTGSRIPRRDYQAESPIVTVPAEAIQASGQPTLGEALNQLPQVSAGDSATRIGGGGRTTVDLRGLGPRRTLVLLDGKRMQPSDLFNSIDLNGIPNSLIGGVEIITGGASAVYGSDALAGVVNFQLRKNFSGVELDAQGGMTGEHDGEYYNITGTVGGPFAEGRGNVVVSASYLDRNEIYPVLSRKFFASPMPGGYPAGLIVPQGNNPYNAALFASLFRSYGVTPAVSINSVLSVNIDDTLWARNIVGGGNFRGYPGEPNITLNGITGRLGGANQTLALPLNRSTAFGRASYELTDHISAFIQLNYSSFKTASRGDALQLPQDTPFVPVTNPFIPADLRALLLSRPNPQAPFFVSSSYNPISYGGAKSESEVWQFQSGLSGTLPSLGWTWDAYFANGRTTQRDTTIGLLNRAVWTNLLNAPDGGRSICAGGLDLFPLTTVSPACQAALVRNPVNFQKLTQQVGEANLQGDLFHLPAGDVRFAVGAAYRRNGFDFEPDPGVVVNPATGFTNLITSGQKTAPASGSTDVKEVYAELLIPLLSDVAFAKRLELDLAYRYSNYDTIGGVGTYKATGEWAPVEGLLIRGGFQRAIRAPSIGELFAPVATGATTSLGNNFATGGGDPCDRRTVYRTGPNGAQVAALCVAQGISANDIATYQIDGTGVPSLVSGNTTLQEEQGDSITIGGVLTPKFSSPFLSGLSLSVDAYDIKIKQAMGIIPGNAVVRACFNTGGENPTYSNTNFYCALIKRGFISLEQVQTPTVNLARIHIAGIDTQLDWRVELEAFGINQVPGSINLNLNVAYLDKYQIASLPGNPLLDYATTIGNDALGGLSHPKWKGIATFTYANEHFELGARARYIGSMRNSQNVNSTLAIAGVASMTYVDLFGRYQLTDDVALRAGVTNLGDRMPPVWTGFGATDRATYDVIGRAFYVGATAHF